MNWRYVVTVGWVLALLGAVVSESSAATSTTLQSAVAADGVGTAATVSDTSEVGLEVAITGRASVNFEGSVDGGTTYRGIVCRKSGSTAGDVATTNTSGMFQCQTGGLSNLRAPVVGWQTGTVTVTALTTAAGSSATATADAPTYTEGTSNALSLDLSGNLRTTQGTTTAGEAVADDVLKVEQRGYYTSITTAATTVVKSGPGWFQGCHVVGGTLGNVTIYDNTAASGAVVVAAFTPATSDDLKSINTSFSVGLTVVTAAATNMTCVVR